MTETIDLKRRYLMAGTVAATGLLASGVRVNAQEDNPLPDYVDWKDPEAMIVHSNNTLETRRDAFGTSILTPEDKLYIRNNVSPPDESILDDRDAWEVSIEGVAEPRTLTVGELKTLGIDTVTMVLQCSGNGRGYFEHAPSGTPWQVGAAGNVMWTGVPLRAVVDALGGPADGANFITGTGGETIPEGLDANDVMVERSVPIDVIDTVMLAWDLNGEPISLAHGGPLRMIVPGFTGVNNVKYVKTVSLTAEETQAAIQRTRYRLQPVGEEGGPEHPSVWQMNVKSFITSPLETASAGTVQVTGVAFGGINAVESVEVSVDGGATWQAAEFIGPDMGRYAWRTFALAADLPAGSHVITSRATDSEGNVQPEDVEPNEPGYNHNGWRAHGVEIMVS
ncbi:sulfite oxidase [Georhizobium sp. MAB10]|jgi:sulfite oxidase|uniref:SorT family sulfite dehydrogenase catalytic subunit n=1 Tax=Georhizobium sp. MAB10 TaxID=3028319 RepID=UPI0038560995